jgi:hypothetical protein
MKRSLVTLGLLALCSFIIAPLAYADGEGSAEADVFVRVDPNIGVSAVRPVVNAGTVQTGEITGNFTFRVDANTEAVEIFIEASELYKGDDPLDPDVAAILLDIESGVEILPEAASPIAGEDNTAAFDGVGLPIASPLGDFPTVKTESIIFESSQNGHFSQPVDVVIKWLQDDPEKPQGEYSGKVRFTALE